MYDIHYIMKRIKQARKDAGLTQEKLAEKMYCKRETIAQWERGQYTPSIDALVRLCDILQCDLGYMLGEYEQKQRETSDACKVTGLSEAVIERFRREEGALRKKQLEEILLDDRFWEILNCFCKWANVPKDLLKKNKEQSDMFWEIVKSGQYPEESEHFRRVSDILSQSARNYEIDKYHCSRLFDEIRDKFLPNVKV